MNPLIKLQIMFQGSVVTKKAGQISSGYVPGKGVTFGKMNQSNFQSSSYSFSHYAHNKRLGELTSLTHALMCR